jgi:hypothetical protein
MKESVDSRLIEIKFGQGKLEFKRLKPWPRSGNVRLERRKENSIGDAEREPAKRNEIEKIACKLKNERSL